VKPPFGWLATHFDGWRLPQQNGQEARAFFSGVIDEHSDITVPLPFIG
jgi:hypothetical protein